MEKDKIGAGRLLNSYRVAYDITMRDLAEKIGLRTYAVMSRWEHGVSPIPYSYLLPLAIALEQNPKEFCLQMMRFLEPELYECLQRNDNNVNKAANGN